MSNLLINDKVGHRALALLQLGAATAAERELFSASLDADPQFIEAILSLANKAVLPSLSIRVGNAAWDQRHRLAGYDGAMYPVPPWQPLQRLLARSCAGLFASCARSWRSIPRRDPMSARWG